MITLSVDRKKKGRKKEKTEQIRSDFNTLTSTGLHNEINNQYTDFA